MKKNYQLKHHIFYGIFAAQIIPIQLLKLNRIYNKFGSPHTYLSRNWRENHMGTQLQVSDLNFL